MDASGSPGLAARAGGGLALTDFAALAAAPDLAAEFEHVVLVDAPRTRLDKRRVAAPFAAAGDDALPTATPDADTSGVLEIARAAMLSAGDGIAEEESRNPSPGLSTCSDSEAESGVGLGFSVDRRPRERRSRGLPSVAHGRPGVRPRACGTRLAGPGPHCLDPESAARAFRVLRELGLRCG